MALKDKLRKRLKKQQKIEGFTPETALLLRILSVIKWESEWRASVSGLRVDGNLYYYPSDYLIKLQKIFEQEK